DALPISHESRSDDDRLMSRYGRNGTRWLVVITGLTLSVILVTSERMFGTFATVTLLCLSLGFASSSDGPYWAAAIDAGGRHSGVAGGIFNTGANLGGLIAPVLTPWIAARAGWSWGLYVGGLIVLAGVVALFFIEGTSPVGPRVESSRHAVL